MVEDDFDEHGNTKRKAADKIELILSAAKDVVAYTQFKSAIDLGVLVRLDEIPFDKALMYSWIDGAYKCQKN